VPSYSVVKDVNGQTPLSWTAQNSHYAVVKLLVDMSAKTSQKFDLLIRGVIVPLTPTVPADSSRCSDRALWLQKEPTSHRKRWHRP
jgi:ankyrin repeat protein